MRSRVMRERRRDGLAVFALALTVRLGVVAWAHARFPAVEDGHYYDVLARRLAGGQGFTWPWPDGVVSYAAHYPVGYPAILALAYAVFGASGGVAMTVNALLGAASAYGAHRLVDCAGVARWRPLAGGLVVAMHPALVAYTPAVMTEGVTAALLVVAAAGAHRARAPSGLASSGWPWVVGAGVVMGVATLVRPQSLVLAPALGALATNAGASWRSRLGRAAVVSGVALACVAPWTVRNCARMNRCALVSVNGGWNLLIGAETTNGSWQRVGVPHECATVWAEAEKDACFERAALREIARAPGAWLARAPAKLAVTLDYFGAAPWYLHASNAAAFDDRTKRIVGVIETCACALLLLGALTATAFLAGSRPLARKVVAIAGAVGAVVTMHAWIAYAAIVVCIAMAGARTVARAPLLVPYTAAVIAMTACVHAVFFGSGRYGLVVIPFVAALAFVGPSKPAAA
jgi:hypothetical protein